MLNDFPFSWGRWRGQACAWGGISERNVGHGSRTYWPYRGQVWSTSWLSTARDDRSGPRHGRRATVYSHEEHSRAYAAVDQPPQSAPHQVSASQVSCTVLRYKRRTTYATILSLSEAARGIPASQDSRAEPFFWNRRLSLHGQFQRIRGHSCWKNFRWAYIQHWLPART